MIINKMALFECNIILKYHGKDLDNNNASIESYKILNMDTINLTRIRPRSSSI